MQENDEKPEEQGVPPNEHASEPVAEPAGPPSSGTEDTPLSPDADTDKMEIHHHSHIHHKKQWQDYLFEFFMLFLAVSLGFLVDNLREHYVEHERAKEYAAMLRKDLESDTTIMNIIIRFRIDQKDKFDSLRTLMRQTPVDKMERELFFRLSAPVGQYLHLIANNGTLQQLKSSGSLRYFTDTTLAYMLTSYEEDLKHGDYVQGEEKDLCSQHVLPFKFKHFNLALEPSGQTPASDLFPTAMLVDFDKNQLLEFYNLFEKCARYNALLGEENYGRHKKKALEIIAMLNKEYHLK